MSKFLTWTMRFVPVMALVATAVQIGSGVGRKW